MRSSEFVFLNSYYLDDHIKDNEMGGACGTYAEERGACSILVVKPRGRDDVGDLGVNGSIMLKWILNRLGRRGLG